VSAPHAGAFLRDVPITACGTRLHDRSLRIAIALRLQGAPVCAEHSCVCGAVIDDVSGTHGFSCRKVASHLAHHNAVNELIHRALLTAGIPSRLEPTKLSHTDDKRPCRWGNDYALVTWKVRSVGFYMSGYPRIQSPESGSAAGPGEVANEAERKKSEKYILS